MPNDDKDPISARALHEALAKRGHAVTKSQLERWRGEGLVPAARQQGAGRGTVVSYPASSIPQAARAVELVVLGKLSIRDARWRMWCEGLPIKRHHWRDEVNAAAELFDRTIGALRQKRDGVEADWELLIEELFATRTKSKAFRRIRKDVGRERFGEVFDQFVDIGTGLFTAMSGHPEADDPDRQRIARGMDVALGLRHARAPRGHGIPELIQGDYSGTLTALSAAIGSEPLRPRLEHMSDETLQRAAQQFTQLAAHLVHAAEMAKALNFRDGLGFGRLASINGAIDAPSSAMLVLLWAMFLTDPRTQGQATGLLQALDALGGHNAPGTSAEEQNSASE